MFEDGTEEAISYFANAVCRLIWCCYRKPFRSTLKKRELIRQTTQRFIEVARPSDKLAIVPSQRPRTCSRFDRGWRAKLFEAPNESMAREEQRFGRTEFTLDQVVGPKTAERRRAIVLMSYGLMSILVPGADGLAEFSFCDLLEAVRHNDTLIIPIFSTRT